MLNLSLRLCVFAAIISLLLAACTGASATTITTGSLAISNVWARANQQSGPGTVGAAYLTITNTGATTDTLRRATTTAAAATELHTMANDGGVMQMRPVVDGVALPAKSNVSFQPGGLHLMLIDLVQPLAQGANFDLLLEFEHAPPITVNVQVRERA